jgi:hypothetical protein
MLLAPCMILAPYDSCDWKPCARRASSHRRARRVKELGVEDAAWPLLTPLPITVTIGVSVPPPPVLLLLTAVQYPELAILTTLFA